MARSLHPEAGAILARLKKEGITSFYHFTSVENLPGICISQALLSKEVLMDHNLLASVNTGGNILSHNLDRFNDNWNKVSLSLTPYIPMAYNRKRETHLCYFIIKPEIATLSDVIFTDTNAASSDHRRGEGLRGIDNINFGVFNSITRIDKLIWKKYIQAEVLIPNSISFEYITEVSFVSEASKMYAEGLCRSLAFPRFNVRKNLFSDSKYASAGAINFSHVIQFAITSTKFDKNMLYFPQKENKISKNSYAQITITTEVMAMAGVKAQILLNAGYALTTDSIVIDEREFAVTNKYKHFCEIQLERLDPGNYWIKYYLDHICWVSANIEVTL